MFFSFGTLLATATIHPVVFTIAKLLLAASFILALVRLLKGPDVTDRVVALDLIAGIVLAFTLFYAISQNELNFMNVSLAIAVIAFLGTVATARYLELGVAAKDAEQKVAVPEEKITDDHTLKKTA